MILRLVSKGLYCVIKLNEVEKVVLSNLAFLASSVVDFLTSKIFFFTLPGLESLAIK